MWRKITKPLAVAGYVFFMAFGVTAINAPAQETKGVPAAEQGAFARSSLFLVTTSGRYRFNVELALTDAQRRLGLMNRPRLDAGAGMLFDFGYPRLVNMWMKNTLIPLDMIFIAADGRIISIAENTTPFSLDVIASGGQARAVLEVNAGTAARLGLKPGDRVEHGIFTKTAG